MFIVRIIQEKLEITSLGHKVASVLFLPKAPVPHPALIMCHAAMDFKENYYEFCEYLASKGIAALAVDMHGFGESEGDRFHVTMEEWVADIRAALSVLQEHPLIKKSKIGAFGVSSGGTAVLECSLVEPGLKALITLDATIRTILSFPESIGIRFLTLLGKAKFFFTGSSLHISLVRSCKKIEVARDSEVNSSWGNNPRVLGMWSAFPFPGSEESLIVDTIRRVHLITVPTLVLHGAEDRIDPPETARLLYGTLTCPKSLHIIEGNGHMGHLDRNKHMVMELTARWALKHLN